MKRKDHEFLAEAIKKFDKSIAEIYPAMVEAYGNPSAQCRLIFRIMQELNREFNGMMTWWYYEEGNDIDSPYNGTTFYHGDWYK